MEADQQQLLIIRLYVGGSRLNHVRLTLQLRPVSVFHSSFSMKGGRLLLTSAFHSKAPHTHAGSCMCAHSGQKDEGIIVKKKSLVSRVFLLMTI